jgi:hypothetical protein
VGALPFFIDARFLQGPLGNPAEDHGTDDPWASRGHGRGEDTHRAGPRSSPEPNANATRIDGGERIL